MPKIVLWGHFSICFFVSDNIRKCDIAANIYLFSRLNSWQVMGNANALVQSDDWAALISDAKARNCFVNMDSIPKGFLVPKAPTYQQPVNASSNLSVVRMPVQRNRHSDMLP